jgi:hypothetical protein
VIPITANIRFLLSVGQSWLQTPEADINKDEQIVPSSIHTVAGVVSRVVFDVACSGLLRTYRDQRAFDYVRRQWA